jgi:phage terminase large subunit
MAGNGRQCSTRNHQLHAAPWLPANSAAYDIIVHPRCTHCIDELSFYSWETDKLTNEILPKLQDKKNHVIDAMRYAVENLRRSSYTLDHV